MNILAAIRREERKLEKQVSKLEHQLSAVRAAAKALGNTAGKEVARTLPRHWLEPDTVTEWAQYCSVNHHDSVSSCGAVLNRREQFEIRRSQSRAVQ